MKKINKYIFEKFKISKDINSSNKEEIDIFIDDLIELLKKEYGHTLDKDYKIEKNDKGCTIALLYNTTKKDFNTFKWLLEKSITDFKYIDFVKITNSSNYKLMWIDIYFK